MKSLRTHIPNIITALNLLSGCLSIAWASYDYLTIAAIFILIAAILDFSDGLAARFLKAYSPIGAQLDSLADMVSFGLAPAFLVFRNLFNLFSSSGQIQDLLSMNWFSGIALFLPFILSIFAALRLAKFNIDTRQKEYFIGLPTPAMALFFASLIYFFQDTYVQLQWTYKITNVSLFWSGCIILFSLLMVSELRMISIKFKNFRWSDNQFQYLFIGISVILLVSLQAKSIPLIILWYIMLSVVYHIYKAKTLSL